MSDTPTLLERLLSPGGLHPRYQPIFEISGERPVVSGVECLTRGPHDTNLAPADLLFAYARHKRAEAEVDRAAILAALAGVRDLAADLDLHVNVHAATLARDAGFAEFLSHAARESSIASTRLTVEVIEESTVTDRDAFLRTLASLRDGGFPIALDDVGLGRSNFLMIYLVRPQVLKADRFFVHGVSGDRLRRAVMTAIQTLAGELGARVVAEGVEQRQDLEVLRELGIRQAQGYLLSRPLGAEDLRALLAAPPVEAPSSGGGGTR